MAYNWLLALGLDFDPAPRDQNVLKAAIAQKKIEWSTKGADPMNGAYFKYLSEHVDAIEGDLFDEAHLSEQESEAQALVYSLLDGYIRTLGGTGTEISRQRLETDVHKLIQRNVRKDTVSGIRDWEYPPEKIVVRAKALGYTVVDGGGGIIGDEEAKKAYEPFSKKTRWAKFDGLKALQTFGATDLYQLAFPDKGTAAKKEQSSVILREIKAIRDTRAILHNQEKTDAENIYNIAVSVFANYATRAEYDEYLTYLAVTTALETAKDEADLKGNSIDDLSFAKAVASVAGAISDKSQAKLIIKGFCIAKKIAVSNASESAVFCRFGHVNKPSSTRCGICGIELSVTCPSCKKSVATSQNYCACGAPIGINIDKAADYCNEAQKLIGVFDFMAARSQLASAKSAWPSLPQITAAENCLTDLESKIGAHVTKLRDAIGKKRFYEAKSLFENVRKQYPGFTLSEETLIRTGMAAADTALAKARLSVNEAERIGYYCEALDASADCSEAMRYIQSHKPEPVPTVSLVVDSKERKARISWDGSPAKGSISYLVVRKEGQPPIDSNDGAEIARTVQLHAVDESIRAGHEYFYAVFVDRYDTVSTGVQVQNSVLILTEVQGLKAVPSAGAVSLGWHALESGSEAEVWLEGPGGGKIACTTSNGYTHTGLTNGRTYTYTVKVVYNITGKRQVTKGVSVSATPVDTADAIDDLHITRDACDKTRFNLAWNEKPGLRIEFHCAQNRSQIPETGTACAMSELASFSWPVTLIDRKLGKATMVHTASEAVYVFAVVRYGSTGIIGNNVRCNSDEEVRIRGISIVNDKLSIRLDAPPTAIGFLVIARNDRFAHGIDEISHDGGQVRKQFVRSLFDKTGVLELPAKDNCDYYISVAAIYGSFAEPSYSDPTEQMFSTKQKDTIYYSINVKRSFFSSTVTITFSSTVPVFLLPETSIIYGIGMVPVFSGDGIEAMRIPEQEINGICMIELRGTLPKTKNVYIKAVPVDDGFGAYKLKSGSSAKIS